jgi:hypothetical protein
MKESHEKVTHLIRTWDEEKGMYKKWAPAEYTKNGWLKCKFGNRKNQRITKLEIVEYAHEDRNKWRCEFCGAVMWDKKALEAHKNTGNCTEGLSKRQRIQLQRTRSREAKARNFQPKYDDLADVKTSQGHKLENCTSFKYLGTTVTAYEGMTAELKRRGILAHSVVGSLKSLWKCRTVHKKLKVRLFQTLVLSILLYNSETWVLTDDEKRLLQAKYFYLAQVAMGESGRWLERDRWKQKESRMDFFARQSILPANELIARRKALWVAHVLRGNEQMMKDCIEASKENQDKWWIAYSEEMENVCGISWEKVEELSKKPGELKTLIDKNYRIRIGTKGTRRLRRLVNLAHRARGTSRE